MGNGEPVIAAALLAAGSSSRFGSTKQLAELDGVPLVRRAVATARDAFGPRILTVIGHEAGAVIRAQGPDAGFAIVNEDFARGMGSSIARAARALSPFADAIVIMLADQPLVSSAHLHDLVATWSGDDHEIVATGFDGTLGPPALFPRGTFDALAASSGDTGARRLFQDDRFSLRTIDFQPAAVDIDSSSDLDAVREELLHLGDDL